jgi:hypothetical protein
MGIFDSISSLFDTAIGDVLGTASGSYLGGSNAGSPSTLSVNYPPYMPQTFNEPIYQPVMAGSSMVPMIVGAGRSLMRFPSLAAAITALGQQFGKRFTPEMIWRMIKSGGPGLVAGLIGAQAMNELFVWKSTHKGRRMNVANTKALRRSLRRLKGFEKLSSRVSAQLARTSHRRGRSKRCGTCRKTPCSC